VHINSMGKIGVILLVIYLINSLYKKTPKASASKNKKISVTNFSFFFLSRDANFSLWSQMFDFPKVFWDFQKWTFINVQF